MSKPPASKKNPISLPFTGESADQFGSAVAISQDGGTLVAAINSDHQQGWGTVYIFRQTESKQWTLRYRLRPIVVQEEETPKWGGLITPWANGRWQGVDDKFFEQESELHVEVGHNMNATRANWFGFGSAIAVNENGRTIVVGAPYAKAEDGDQQTGAVYIFQEEEAKRWRVDGPLLPAETDYDKNFGQAVAISEQTIVAGAMGAAYTFETEPMLDWAKPTSGPLPRPARVSSANFGKAVAVSGATIAVGAPARLRGTGHVCIYEPLEPAIGDRWSSVTTTPIQMDRVFSFGQTVALYANTLAVGAPESKNIYIIEPNESYALQPWTRENRSLKKLSVNLTTQLGNSLALGRDLVATVDQNGRLHYATRHKQRQLDWTKLKKVANGGTANKVLALSGHSIVSGQPTVQKVEVVTLPSIGKPNLLMRDNFLDSGHTASKGTLHLSPDILPLTSQVTNPTIRFGSATGWDEPAHHDVKMGQDNYIYLRIKNIGAVPVAPTAHLYSSVPSSFLDPRGWEPVGTLQLDAIEPGEKAVCGPIVWTAAQIARVAPAQHGTVHRCYICYLTWPGQSTFLNPQQLKAQQFAHAEHFYRFVAKYPHICFHNINVVPPNADALQRTFQLVALPNSRSAQYKLAMVTNLADGTDVTVRYKRKRVTLQAHTETAGQEVVVDDAITLEQNARENVTFELSGRQTQTREIIFRQYSGTTLMGGVKFEIAAAT